MKEFLMQEINFTSAVTVPSAPCPQPHEEGETLTIGGVHGGYHGPIIGELIPKNWPLRGCASESSGKFCLQMKISGFLSAILQYETLPKDIRDTLAARARCAFQDPTLWHQLVQEIVEAPSTLHFSGHLVSPLPSVALNTSLAHMLGT